MKTTATDYGVPPSPPGPGLRLRTALFIGLAVVVLAAVVVGVYAATYGEDLPDVAIDRDPIPTTAPMTEEQRVVDAVQKFFTYQDQAAAIPDPDFALLTVHATGAELQSDIEAMRKLRDQGQATQRPPNSISEDRVKVVSIEGDKGPELRYAASATASSSTPLPESRPMSTRTGSP